jgi:hypothetical protein
MTFATLDAQETRLATYLEEIRQTSFSSRYASHMSVWVCVRCKARFSLSCLKEHIDKKLVKSMLAYFYNLRLLGIRMLSSTNRTVKKTLMVMYMHWHLRIM